MHALRKLVQAEMDRRLPPMTQADLSRASGLSRQLVSNLLTDDRDTLPEMPARATMEALASAFAIPVARIMLAAARAYGVPVDEPELVATVDDLPDSDLARELLRRAEQREAGVGHVRRDSAPMNEASGVVRQLPGPRRVPAEGVKRAARKARPDTGPDRPPS